MSPGGEGGERGGDMDLGAGGVREGLPEEETWSSTRSPRRQGGECAGVSGRSGRQGLVGGVLELGVKVGGVGGAGRRVRARTGPWRVSRYGGRCWKGEGGGQEAGTARVVQREMLGARVEVGNMCVFN